MGNQLFLVNWPFEVMLSCEVHTACMANQLAIIAIVPKADDIFKQVEFCMLQKA